MGQGSGVVTVVAWFDPWPGTSVCPRCGQKGGGGVGFRQFERMAQSDLRSFCFVFLITLAFLEYGYCFAAYILHILSSCNK